MKGKNITHRRRDNIARQRLEKLQRLEKGYSKGRNELRKLAKSLRICAGALHYFLEFKELLEEFKEFNRRNGT